MDKVVHWCYLRQIWYVYNKHLKYEVGWFTTKREADICASQLEMNV